MFSIGFFEVIVVLVVALLVFGPGRLPGAVRQTALVISRIKRKWQDIRAEIEKEVNADEIRRTIHNEQVLHDLKKQPSAIRDTPDNSHNKESATKSAPERTG